MTVFDILETSVDVNSEANDFLDQYRNIKLFYKEYVEELLSPYISYADVKNTYPIQVIDLRFQVDHINRKKKQLFVEYRNDPAKASLFLILIRHREIKMVMEIKLHAHMSTFCGPFFFFFFSQLR